MKKLALYQCLSMLGTVWSLDLEFDLHHLNDLFIKNKKLWSLYGEKTENPRYGIPLTSIDGTYNRTPNLRSLGPYNKEHGTNFSELDYKIKTPLLAEMKSLLSFFNYFPDIGRICAIQLLEGGYFPPHRDGAGLIEKKGDLEVFRLLLPIKNFDGIHTVLSVDRKNFFLNAGQVYFIDTMKLHSLVTFSKQLKFIIFSIPLTEKNINTALSLRLCR